VGGGGGRRRRSRISTRKTTDPSRCLPQDPDVAPLAKYRLRLNLATLLLELGLSSRALATLDQALSDPEGGPPPGCIDAAVLVARGTAAAGDPRAARAGLAAALERAVTPATDVSALRRAEALLDELVGGNKSLGDAGHVRRATTTTAAPFRQEPLTTPSWGNGGDAVGAPSTTAKAPLPPPPLPPPPPTGGVVESSSSGDPATLVDRAVALVNVGEIDAAEALLTSAIDAGNAEGATRRNRAADVRLLSAHVTRGTARALRATDQDLAMADEDFTAAIALEPRFADAWKRRGQARAALGRVGSAVADLERAAALLSVGGPAAVARSPEHCAALADVYAETGKALARAGRYDEAADQLRAGLALDPRPQGAWLALGRAQIALGDLDDAAESLGKAVTGGGKAREAWFHLGYCLKERAATVAEAAEAARALEQAAALDPAGLGGATARSARRLMVELRRGLGDHGGAVALASVALADAEAAGCAPHETLELRQLRASWRALPGPIGDRRRLYTPTSMHNHAHQDSITPHPPPPPSAFMRWAATPRPPRTTTLCGPQTQGRFPPRLPRTATPLGASASSSLTPAPRRPTAAPSPTDPAWTALCRLS